jgi:hypothetical protein
MHIQRIVAGSVVVSLLGSGLGTAQPEQEGRRGVRTPEGELVLLNKDFREPTCVLDDFHDAAAKADFQRYFSHWTGESVFLGTDATERWVGDEFREFARPHFEKGKGWRYVARDRKVTPAPGGQYAYFDELLSNDKLGTCRGSGVLRLVDGEWKILQYNLSVPIPNEMAADVVALIRPAAEPKSPVQPQ